MAEGYIPIEARSGRISSASKDGVCLKKSSGAGFNAIEACHRRVLTRLMPSASYFESLFCECVVARKVYNNDDITFFSVYQRLQSPCVIMCCSPHHFADRAATHFNTQAWKMLIQGKECFILLLMLCGTNL